MIVFLYADRQIKTSFSKMQTNMHLHIRELVCNVMHNLHNVFLSFTTNKTKAIVFVENIKGNSRKFDSSIHGMIFEGYDFLIHVQHSILSSLSNSMCCIINM